MAFVFISHWGVSSRGAARLERGKENLVVVVIADEAIIEYFGEWFEFVILSDLFAHFFMWGQQIGLVVTIAVIKIL
jgi:hypothetical protein